MLAVLLPTDRSRSPIWLLIPPPIHLTARPNSNVSQASRAGNGPCLPQPVMLKTMHLAFDRSPVIHLEAPGPCVGGFLVFALWCKADLKAITFDAPFRDLIQPTTGHR